MKCRFLLSGLFMLSFGIASVVAQPNGADFQWNPGYTTGLARQQPTERFSLPTRSGSREAREVFAASENGRTSAAIGWEKLHKPSEGDYIYQLQYHHDTLYMADGRGKVFLSADKGDHWKQLGSFRFPFFAMSLKWTMCPLDLQVNDHMVFYFGNYSLDRGKTWKHVIEPSLDYFKSVANAPGSGSFSILGYFVDGTTVYMLTFSHGVFKTTDLGKNWIQMKAGLPLGGYWGAAPIMSLMVNNGKLFCYASEGWFSWGTNKPSEGTFEWNGSKWLATGNISFQADNVSTNTTFIRFNRTVAKTAAGYFYSENGANWHSATDVDFSNVNWVPERIYRTNTNEVFAVGSDWKIHVSENKGLTWTELNVNKKETYFQSQFAITGMDDDVFIGLTTGFYRSTSPFTNWESPMEGLEDINYEAWGNATSMLEVKGKLLACSVNGICESSDNGETWKTLDNEMRFAWTSGLLSHHENLYSISRLGFMKSADDGRTWDTLATGVSKNVRHLCRMFSNDISLFLSVSDSRGLKIIRSDDDGETWNPVWTDFYDQDPREWDMVVSYACKGETIFVGTQYKGTFRSDDNGDTWYPVRAEGLPTIEWQGKTYFGEVQEMRIIDNTLFSFIGSLKYGSVTEMHRSEDWGKTWSRVVVDSAFEAPGSLAHAKVFSQLKKINNTLVLYAYNGWGPPKGFVSGFTPSVADHYFYTSTDNGATWSLVKTIDSSMFPGLVSSLHYSDGVVFGAQGWMGGGLYKIPLTAFGIEEPLTVFTEDTHSKRKSQVEVPIKVNGFKNILGSQFSLSWDPAVLKFESLSDFALSNNEAEFFNLSLESEGKILFTWSSPDVTAKTLADSSALFICNFIAIGNFNDTTSVRLTAQPLSTEFVDSTFQTIAFDTRSGIVTIEPGIILSGDVINQHDKPVPGAMVTIAGGVSVSAESDSAGKYAFEVMGGESYQITAAKSDRSPDAINVQDVAMLRRHLLRTDTLSTHYKIIAGDVNLNNNISIQDIVLIQAFILGKISDFPGSHEWVFIPKGYEFDDFQSTFPFDTVAQVNGMQSEDIDFIGVELGDVITSEFDAGGRIIRAVSLVTSAQYLDPGNLEVTFTVKDFENIAAFQFTLAWDCDEFEIISASNENIQPLFGDQDLSLGKLHVIWDDQSGKSISMRDGQSIIRLVFKPKGSAQFAIEFEHNQQITPLAFNKNLEPLILDLEQRSNVHDAIHIYPNPFDTNTTISMNAKAEDLAIVSIYSPSGALIGRSNWHLRVGKNILQWRSIVTNPQTESGLYVVTVKAKNGTSATKLIKLAE